MLEHLPTLVKTFSCCTTHPTHLAPPKIGDGPGWAATTIAKGEQVCSSSHRIFHKVVEAKPLTKITSETLKKFFWQNIICIFEIPRTLIVDNGK